MEDSHYLTVIRCVPAVVDTVNVPTEVPALFRAVTETVGLEATMTNRSVRPAGTLPSWRAAPSPST